MNDEKFMRQAIELSMSAVAHGNEPFGAVLVKDDEIVFSNENQIYTKHDPTYHGEAGLIRDFAPKPALLTLVNTLYTQVASLALCAAVQWFGLNSVGLCMLQATMIWKKF